MTYKDFPVYIGHGNRRFTSEWGYSKRHMIYADRVNVNFSTASVPNRRLSRSIDRGKQFSYTSDVSCDIAFDFLFYPNPRERAGNTVYAFLSDSDSFDQDNAYIRGSASGTNFFPIRVGSNLYNKCLLENYNIEITAASAVKCSVNFKCYDPPSEEAVKKDNFIPDGTYNDYMSGDAVVDGTSCEMSGFYGDFIDNSIVPKITYSKSYNRTPVYRLGDIKASDYLINSIEAQMVVESTGLSNIIGYNGIKLENDIGVNILNNNGERILPEYDGGFDILIKSGARVNSEDYNIQGGDVVSSRVTIQEVVL